ncbi:cellulose biosynthesis protein BcsQ [Kosakonia sp. R1.Fl]|uniref:cellulose biosynthesis protein BcsQ n=1 Tax=Kosakonia sp. R1.Fl TaxID=2928706 RepID=UPI00201E4A66|nr:cellulose biosynthesis protein BcsQ [Kosakonia sp. R1.Fl]MCL6743062.1 cellulose biosynthesis protein BcsQ [Kosakonia sp. R1.Fl]
MAILGLQGIRGGVGTTSITAALAWSLQILGESVLVIDACPDNLLRLSFNVDFEHHHGWARAVLDGQDWRDAGMRYTSQLDLLPFGRLAENEWENLHLLHEPLSQLTTILQALKTQQSYQWVLIDLPHGASPLTRQFVAQCDHLFTVVKPDTNCHIRLHQQLLPAGAHILLNDLRIGSQLQDDLWQVWLQSQRQILPTLIHRDEAMAESQASKQPLGEYRADSLAAEEILTLANWCLLHCAQPQEVSCEQEGSPQ